MKLEVRYSTASNPSRGPVRMVWLTSGADLAAMIDPAEAWIDLVPTHKPATVAPHIDSSLARLTARRKAASATARLRAVTRQCAHLQGAAKDAGPGDRARPWLLKSPPGRHTAHGDAACELRLSRRPRNRAAPASGER
jgi:hypothetical protein